MRDTDFAYAVAKVRVFETKLFSATFFERLIIAPTYEDGLKLLNDSGYNPGDGQLLSYANFNKALAHETEGLFEELCAISPIKGVFNIFLYKNDFHNAKVLLKNLFRDDANRKKQNTEGIDELPLVAQGNISLALLKQAVAGENSSDVPEILMNAINEAKANFSRTNNPQNIDLLIDAACFEMMLKEAENTGIQIIKNIISEMIDITNILTFLRARKIGSPMELAKKGFIPGGKISMEILTRLMAVSLSDFKAHTEHTYLSDPLAFVIKEAKDFKNLNIGDAEKILEEFSLKRFTKGRLNTFGIEPLLSYMFLKLNEIKNVRIVMTGKLNNIEPSLVRSRVRNAYV